MPLELVGHLQPDAVGIGHAPALREPRLDGVVIRGLALLAQQQIDLERAVDLGHLARGDDPGHAPFQVQDQARAHHPLQRPGIGVGGDAVQAVALAKAEPLPDAGILAVAIAGRHIGDLVEQG